MRFIFLSLHCMLFTSPLFSQTQITDLNFETWQTTPYQNLNYPLTTLNQLSTFGAPLTVERTTDSHSGFAAKLTTQEFGTIGFTILLSGLVTTGTFTPDITDIAGSLNQGTPFTARPDSLKGWYKYTPAGGDSAAIAIVLTRYNTVTHNRDTIANSSFIETNSVSTYNYLSLPIEYFSASNPDSIFLVFSSSAGGGNVPPVGIVGSTFYIDDFSFVYNSTAISEIISLENNLTIQNAEVFVKNISSEKLCIYDNSGKNVFSEILEKNNFKLTLPTGIYFYHYGNEKGRFLVN